MPHDPPAPGATFTPSTGGSEPTFDGADVEGVGRTFVEAADGATDAPRTPAPARYEVVRELARGGLGRVLVGHDRVLDRPVAIKELLRPSPGARARFAREVSVTARLEHPSIVPVHDAGTWPGGEPFYTMKLVSGRTLAEAVAERTTLVDRLKLLGTVIDVGFAVAYAHDKGVIHRDLKPQNVLVGEFGETVVVDWGLARNVGDAEASVDGALSGGATSGSGASLTRVGAVVGTPAYMPPEQAAGRPLDARADVYALGAVLYEVLAGVRPYHDCKDVVGAVAVGPPVALERLAPAVPRDLLAIVDRAMARDPAARYPTARELALDLERFRDGQVVAAYRYGPVERIRRFVARNRAASGLAAALALVVVVAFVVVLHWQRVATAAEERERRRADALAVEQARLALDRDPREALRLLRGLSPGGAPPGEVRTLAADALGRGLAADWPPHEGAVSALAFGRDGAFVISASHDGTVAVRAPDGVLRHRLPHPKGVLAAVTLAGARVATACDDTVRVWDAGTGALLATLPHPLYVQSLEASADGSAFVTTSLDAAVRVFEADGTPRWTRPEAHAKTLMHAAFSPDGTRVASAGTDARVRAWDAATGVPAGDWAAVRSSFRVAWSADSARIGAIGTDLGWRVDVATGATIELSGHAAWPSALAFLPDGVLATAAGDRTIRLWRKDDSGTGKVLVGHDDAITALVATADGALISSAGDGTVRRWNPRNGASTVLRAHHAPVVSVVVAPDGRIVAGAVDGSVTSWDPSAIGAAAVPVGDGKGVVRAVSLDPRGDVAFGDEGLWALDVAARTSRRLDPTPLWVGRRSGDRRVALTAAGELAIWDASGARLALAPAHEGPGAIAVTPDGRIGTSGTEGGVRAWTADGAGGEELVRAGAPVSTLAWSPDGRFLVGGSDDRKVYVLEPGSGRPPVVLDAHRTFVTDVAFAGDRLITSEAGGTVLAWDDLGGSPRSTPLGGSHVEAPSMATSPDGRWVAIGDAVGVVTLVELATGRSRALVGHTQYLADLVFAPDGRRLLTTSWDGTGRLWDLSDPLGAAMPTSRVLSGNGKPVVTGAFSPDGTHLATVGQDRMVRVWRDDLPFDDAALRAALAATP